MKKVTENEIQKLYEFTSQHYVKHFDVQTELVDHLANDIEDIWKENPILTFEEARNKSFKKFGVFGFMDVYEQRQKVLEKKYFKILWQYTKKWFQLPKIVMTITLFLIFYLCLKELGELFYVVTFLCITLLAGVKSILLIREIKKHQQQTNKKWLLEDYIFKGPSFNFIFLIYYIISFNLPMDFDKIGSSINHYWIGFYSLILTFLVISLYVILFVLPPKAEQFLKKEYPEYTLA